MLHIHCQSPDLTRAFWTVRKSTTKDPKHVLKSFHAMSTSECCIAFVPEGGDTSPASARTTVDAATRTKVEQRIALRPTPQTSLVCRICKGMMRAKQVKYGSVNVRLPESPEGIVWHLRTWCVHHTGARRLRG